MTTCIRCDHPRESHTWQVGCQQTTILDDWSEERCGCQEDGGDPAEFVDEDEE